MGKHDKKAEAVELAAEVEGKKERKEKKSKKPKGEDETAQKRKREAAASLSEDDDEENERKSSKKHKSDDKPKDKKSKSKKSKKSKKAADTTDDDDNKEDEETAADHVTGEEDPSLEAAIAKLREAAGQLDGAGGGQDVSAMEAALKELHTVATAKPDRPAPGKAPKGETAEQAARRELAEKEQADADRRERMRKIAYFIACCAACIAVVNGKKEWVKEEEEVAIEEDENEEERRVKRQKEKKAKKAEKEKAEKQKAEKEKAEKEKAEKKSKPTPKLPKESTHEANPSPSVGLSERWSVNELGGGESRQDKFMRLLGGKKAGAAATVGGPARPKLDSNHVAKELEQQFEAGVRMKYELGGQKRGLGA
ncbi:small acidic protein family-domain-containing protein [Cercophora scortea]|uniref:Small acidic protein n=1 Tax=Cercophora scortea TaxID=314031 RepID=A0AAE0ILZ7_9PEZI|nr:small acidic protein family-domain-containing protein [Cercophora scortea]